MKQTVSVTKLLSIYDLCGYSTIFSKELFLGWIWQESSGYHLALRFDDYYKADCEWKKITGGLVQLSFDNMSRLILDKPADIEKCLRLIRSPIEQMSLAREFLRTCASRDPDENLYWWNTGTLKKDLSTRTKNGLEYVEKVHTWRDRLRHTTVDSKGFYEF